jgi:PHD/YefM family antitoxin component YafN of YafNO toxin-antitoxin module
MPAIRPSADLRNDYDDISEFCHKYREPVYITKDGHGDLAVMSIEVFEGIVARQELYGLLEKGTDDIRNGRTMPAAEAFERVEALLHGEDID